MSNVLISPSLVLRIKVKKSIRIMKPDQPNSAIVLEAGDEVYGRLILRDKEPWVRIEERDDCGLWHEELLLYHRTKRIEVETVLDEDHSEEYFKNV